MFSAVRSVKILKNCFVDLIRNEGSITDGRWCGDLVSFQTNQPAHKCRASPKELTWIDNGGERLNSSYKIHLFLAPQQTPEFIRFNDVLYKVISSDERSERKFWKYLCVEQFDENNHDEL